MLELRRLPGAGAPQTPVPGGVRESPVNRKKSPCFEQKIPCSAQKSSLLLEQEFPVISSLMRRGEGPWFAERGPPRRPLPPSGGWAPGVLILVFSTACGYSSATRYFFLLQNQDSCYGMKRARWRLSNRRRPRGEKKFAFESEIEQ
jgi:hypothetical protein